MDRASSSATEDWGSINFHKSIKVGIHSFLA